MLTINLNVARAELATCGVLVSAIACMHEAAVEAASNARKMLTGVSGDGECLCSIESIQMRLIAARNSVYGENSMVLLFKKASATFKSAMAARVKPPAYKY